MQSLDSKIYGRAIERSWDITEAMQKKAKKRNVETRKKSQWQVSESARKKILLMARASSQKVNLFLLSGSISDTFSKYKPRKFSPPEFHPTSKSQPRPHFCPLPQALLQVCIRSSFTGAWEPWGLEAAALIGSHALRALQIHFTHPTTICWVPSVRQPCKRQWHWKPAQYLSTTCSRVCRPPNSKL